MPRTPPSAGVVPKKPGNNYAYACTTTARFCQTKKTRKSPFPNVLRPQVRTADPTSSWLWRAGGVGASGREGLIGA